MESFEQLAQQYQPMIHKIINSLHIYKNKDEFYQNGLIALWEASKRFNPEKGSFAGYAYSYMKGCMLTEIKKSVKEAERCVCPKEEFWEQIEDPSDVDDRLMLDNDLLHDCSQSLTDNQRKWLRYTIHYELTVKEIAQLEHVSLTAVKGWRAGARAKLKR
ncbi:sigma-70 family RNA polymerase sigma factor [Neobacillus mesonae]|uniref:sigma-70 family RNA polymerase sigma factor n=1 Tax=Neobacillus mesonae TaxID=1193713 RepID=UPI002573F752|nr:sigma-70 family RNA polymerase sigma factor [Neobacillus mesonae]MED4203759.1 sigma-70 family RNA polymerase sigma factor [Neobacillus mesonae]